MLNLSSQSVALLGRLGHGKTTLMNKVCGTRHPANAGSESCTRHVQHGLSKLNKVSIIDTPGSGASEDIAGHIAAIKVALEGIPLSGVYVTVKFGRADDIAQLLDPVMTFVGSDDIRVIVTFADVYSGESNFNIRTLKAGLNNLLDIPVANITVVGKGTSSATIEQFIVSTLHEPRMLTISEAQIAALTSLSPCQRKYNKMINDVFAKIEAAIVSCDEVSRETKNHETDTVIVDTQRLTTNMVEASKENIFREAAESLSCDQQNVVYGRAGLTLTMKLKEFMEATNKFLSRDVTDPQDAQNHYKKCNHCGAIWIKTEGCDGATICGNIPSREIRRYGGGLRAEFAKTGANKWFVRYFLDGYEVLLKDLPARLAQKLRVSRSANNGANAKRAGTVFETGCGRGVNWATMIPLSPEELRCLGTIEMRHQGQFEALSRHAFRSILQQKERHNQRLLEKLKLSN